LSNLIFSAADAHEERYQSKVRHIHEERYQSKVRVPLKRAFILPASALS
jgi:hypothetical protein